MGLIPEGKTPTVGYLRPHHRAMARSILTGATNADLARIYDFTPGQITRIVNSPLFQAELARLEAQAEYETTSIHQDLQVLSHRAIEILSGELDREPQSVADRKIKKEVAFGVLDRAGYAKRESPQYHLHKHEHEHHASNMNDDDLYRDVLDLARDEYEEVSG